MKMIKQCYGFTDAEPRILFILIQPHKFPVTLKLWTIILNKCLKYISPVIVHKRTVTADGFNKNTKLQKFVDQEICKIHIYVACVFLVSFPDRRPEYQTVRLKTGHLVTMHQS